MKLILIASYISIAGLTSACSSDSSDTERTNPEITTNLKTIGQGSSQSLALIGGSASINIDLMQSRPAGGGAITCWKPYPPEQQVGMLQCDLDESLRTPLVAGQINQNCPSLTGKGSAPASIGIQFPTCEGSFQINIYEFIPNLHTSITDRS